MHTSRECLIISSILTFSCFSLGYDRLRLTFICFSLICCSIWRCENEISIAKQVPMRWEKVKAWKQNFKWTKEVAGRRTKLTGDEMIINRDEAGGGARGVTRQPWQWWASIWWGGGGHTVYTWPSHRGNYHVSIRLSLAFLKTFINLLKSHCYL